MSNAHDLSTASDQEVVASARQGRDEGYRELLRRYQPPVFSLIHHIVRHRELAEDLTQETFVKACQALESRPPDRNVGAWILSIANHAAVDHLRRRQLDTLPLGNSPEVTPSGKDEAAWVHVANRTPTPPARVDPRKLAPAFEEAIRRLRPKYRRVVVLRLVEERSYDNIAEIMDLPLGTVKGYLHRAKHELRELLGTPDNFARSDPGGTPV